MEGHGRDIEDVNDLTMDSEGPEVDMEEEQKLKMGGKPLFPGSTTLRPAFLLYCLSSYVDGKVYRRF